ncbi:hemolysin family protein [Parasediminibacterium sp. JCM 36343]|uniref:hemolysin family protein n=1 Tax=Parasediminibacterium sp. JCM 36343 TaxID=3374279 RepID=UPI003979FF32
MIEFLIIIGLVLLNGLFAMAEISLVSARKARLEAQANKGDKKARRALLLTNRPDTFIATVQIGITLISILLGIYAEEGIKQHIADWLQHFPVVKPYINSISKVLMLIVITYVSLVLGELVPKRIGLSNPEAIAKIVAGPMQVLSTITFPFLWLLNHSSDFLVNILGIKHNDTSVTEEEIKAIISEGTEQGTIEEAEQEIIERVFHLSDRNITSLMTHRSDIEWLEATKTVGEVKGKLKEAMHSVYPVCEGSIDKIKGFVTIKELFTADAGVLLESIIKQPMYVPENNTAYQVLEKFKGTKIHHCFIVNEYGSVEGLITLNDILEAIVGDIPQPDEEAYEITERPDGSFLIDAQLSFYDFLKHIDKTEWIDEIDQEFDTLAGFILTELQEIPKTGDTFSWRGYDFEIVDMDNHRIDKVLVKEEQGNGGLLGLIK